MVAKASEALRLYRVLVAANVRAQMQYRWTFFLEVFRLLLLYAFTALTLWLMMRRFPSLAGWRFEEAVFLLALAILSWGFCLLFFFHFRALEHYVVRGTFDRFLVRPLSPFFQYLASEFQVVAVGQFLFSLAAFWLITRRLDIDWSPFTVTFLALTVLGGALIQGGAVVLVSALAFWTTRSIQAYYMAVRPARELTWYPVTIYHRGVQWAVVYVLPFAFINYFPAQVILGRHDPAYPAVYGYLSPLVGVAFFALAYGLWQRGVNRYQSTGS